jgi:hypothetical protein
MTLDLNDFEKQILCSVDEISRTAGQIRRLARSPGQLLHTAQALDRLWRKGLIERDVRDVGITARRLGGGGELRALTFRRKDDPRSTS